MTNGRTPFVVFGFASVHDALEAESALRGAGIPSVTVPSPRELGELCGIALRLDPADAESAARLLDGAGLPPVATAEILDR